MRLKNLSFLRVMAFPAWANKAVNPYNAQLYDGIRDLGAVVEEYGLFRYLRRRPDILHIHWPDGYVNERSVLKALQRMVLLSLVVLAGKLRGTALIWTVHNLEPHDAFHPALARHFLQWFARRCDGLIFLSRSSRTMFVERYYGVDEIPFAVIPHGHYRNVYGPQVTKDAARQRLSLPMQGTVLLLFGMVKPYKNATGLIEAFVALADPSIHLVIAGAPASAALAEQLQVLAAGRADIHLDLSFIQDTDVAAYVGAADLVVLPYRNVLNSGAALLALSFDRPVLAPRLGSLEEIRAKVGEAWVHLYDESDLSAAVLKTAISRLNEKRDDKCDLMSYEWTAISRQTLDFYQAVAHLQGHGL